MARFLDLPAAMSSEGGSAQKEGPSMPEDADQISGMAAGVYDQLADNFTKANPTELFKYLRDCMNGYAAALLHNPQRQMPLECMTLPELRSMLGDLEQQDKAKVAKAAEKAAAKRHKTK